MPTFSDVVRHDIWDCKLHYVIILAHWKDVSRRTRDSVSLTEKSFSMNFHSLIVTNMQYRAWENKIIIKYSNNATLNGWSRLYWLSFSFSYIAYFFF